MFVRSVRHVRELGRLAVAHSEFAPNFRIHQPQADALREERRPRNRVLLTHGLVNRPNKRGHEYTRAQYEKHRGDSVGGGLPEFIVLCPRRSSLTPSWPRGLR